MEFMHSFLRRHFMGKGDVAKCRLFSQAMREYSFLVVLLLNRNNIINFNAQRANIKNYDPMCRSSLRVTSQGKFINFDQLMS